jgi:hypothetical protein
MYGEMRNAYKILVGKPRHRWEDISMDLREIGLEGMDWTLWAWNRFQWQALVNMVTNLWVP